MWNELLEQEEVPRFQKSREQWLKCGDRNTKFLEPRLLSLEDSNLIESLQNENGQWTYDGVELVEMARLYYSDLYTSDPDRGGPFISGCFRFSALKQMA